MEKEIPSKTAKTSREDLDAISNRIALALAQREALVKSWMGSSSNVREPYQTPEELDAEDALLFRNQPQYLGVGAAIPAEYLEDDTVRNKKVLQSRLLHGKGLKASKARSAEEKEASVKRGIKHESSDEGEGRSALGRTKKTKTTKHESTKVVEEVSQAAKVLPKPDFEKKSEHEANSDILQKRKKRAELRNGQNSESSDEDETPIPKRKKTSQTIGQTDPAIASKIEARLKALLQNGSAQDRSQSDDVMTGPLSRKEHDKGKGEPDPAAKEDVQPAADGSSEVELIDSKERKRLRRKEKKRRQKLKAVASALKE